MSFEMLPIDASKEKLENICWTLICMYNHKYGDWKAGYTDNTISQGIARFKRDFKQDDCVDVGKLCAALFVAFLPIAGSHEKAKTLMLHIANHLIDIAYASDHTHAPEGPTMKNKGNQ